MRTVGCLLGITLAASSSLAACGAGPSFSRGDLLIRSKEHTVVLHVEIAQTEAARQKGLMGRRGLGPDAGMVFLFDRPNRTGFWMKDTLIPLDIAFWTKGGAISAVLHMTPCRAGPCPLYTPDQPYVGAVEANAGFFGRHGVAQGDLVRLIR